MPSFVRRNIAPLIFALLPAAGFVSPAVSEELTIAQAIERHLQGIDSGLIVNAATRRVADLEKFYQQRDYRPIWVADGAPTRAVVALREILATADRDGLDPDAYDAGEFSPRAPYGMARFEVAQSAALLRYVSDLRNGRVAPEQVEADLIVEPRPVDALQILMESAGNLNIAAYLAKFVPANPAYRALRGKLLQYRALAAGGGWETQADTGSLARGSTGPAVGKLRRRLHLEDNRLALGAAHDIFDETLHDAVIRFQTRHGLATDGVVGPRTRAALNVTAADRVRQIIVNMERWRWMPDDLGRRHIVVNIAGFELDAVADGQVRHNMRVVVGRLYRRTPLFSGRMTYLEVNPYWHVPPVIAVRDLLPKIRDSIDFLTKGGFRVFDGWGANAHELEPRRIEWPQTSPERFPYKLRQEPGPENTLGQVKFMFPNRHNVYLHDTPSRSLFDRPVRTFSSGCIRVERARDLALFVLDGDADWTAETLAAALDETDTRKIVLDEPLPVHITYQTAWVDGAGTAQFRDDVYARDAALARHLFAPRKPDNR